MEIQVGEVKMEKVGEPSVIIQSKETKEKQILKPNKTRKYLIPCLKEYGATFTAMLESVYKVAVGIGDAILINRDIKHEKHIFILLDSKIVSQHFISFLNWIREQDIFVDDYVYGDIQKSTFHMVIIKFPEKYYHSFETFKIGDYSKMYELGDIEKFFKNHQNTKAVLVKDHNYRVIFTKKLNKEWGTTLKPDDIKGELDEKPTDISEIFNHHLKL